jgi:hypothetical protein
MRSSGACAMSVVCSEQVQSCTLRFAVPALWPLQCCQLNAQDLHAPAASTGLRMLLGMMLLSAAVAAASKTHTTAWRRSTTSNLSSPP